MSTAATLFSPALLHLFALISLAPFTLHALLPLRGSILSNARLFLPLSFFSAFALSLWLWVRLSNDWAFGFGAALDMVAITTFSAFALTVFIWREAKGIAPLVLLYCIPLLALAQLYGNFSETAEAEIAKDGWFWAHILLAGPAFGVISVAALAGLAVSLRERALKNRRFNHWIDGYPALVTAENLQFRLLGLALALLAGAVATGVAVELVVTGTFHGWLDHKSILTLVGMAVLICLLAMHHWFGLRGRLAVRVVLIAFLLLHLAYPGVKFISDHLVAG